MKLLETDPRIAELKDLAREEGFELPYPADYIVWLEDRGKIVNLLTGEVWDEVVIESVKVWQRLPHCQIQ